MLWTSPYEVWRPPTGGQLIAMGEPEAVEWWRMGRWATREEVLASVESGLPLLRDHCFTPDDFAGLEAYVARFAKYLPPEQQSPPSPMRDGEAERAAGSGTQSGVTHWQPLLTPPPTLKEPK